MNVRIFAVVGRSESAVEERVQQWIDDNHPIAKIRRVERVPRRLAAYDVWVTHSSFDDITPGELVPVTVIPGVVHEIRDDIP